MKRGNLFVLLAATVVCFGVCRSNGAAVAAAVGKLDAIGVRSMPDHDSEAMTEFKRGLNAEETDLLKRHASKTRFIQPLMDTSRVMVSRRNKLAEVAAAVQKRNENVAKRGCCSCRGDTSGCYHPDDVKRSNIIQCCHNPPPASETVAVDERGVKVDKAGQNALSAMSPEDQALLQRYSSKIKNLVEAQQRPESNGNTDKREQDDEAETVDAAGQQALDSLSQADKELLQKHLSKIDNLVVAEQRPESNGNTDKREQVDDVASHDKKDETGTVIQKLYDQLEGLKQVVGDLKAQQQHVQKKGVDMTASKRDVDEISQRLWADVHLAKEKGIKLNDILGAIKKRASKAKQN